MPTKLKFPRSLLSRTSSHSPWKIFTSIAVWPSAAIEKTCDFLVGMVVLREISLVMMPLSVSIPAKHVNLVIPEDGDNIPSDKDIKKENICDVSSEDATLNGCEIRKDSVERASD
jgi:hypothetical protein